MKLYPPEERVRRIKILQEEIKKESWQIILDSMEAWCYAKSREVVELHADGKHDEAKELAIKIWAIRRVFQEPDIIVRETTSWLKKFEWMKRIMPKEKVKNE